MSRPAHIAPLDAALEQHLHALVKAEAQQRDVLTKHADALREVEAAKQARQDAFYAAQQCERAIRKLGYVVLRPGGTVPPNESRLDEHSGRFRERTDTAQTEAPR